jgi:superfamily II DNA or RNA helicase
MAGEDILKEWETLPLDRRDELMETIEARGLYPRIMTVMDVWEAEAGLYPDTEDPRFTEKLMQKQEFAENKQDSIAEQQRDGVNPCDPEKEFELTPVQRFIGRFLSPQCPYQSALLFHGVGVGKTCAAITVAENYLRTYPRRQVIIVAPRNIQPGFRRTIFDDEALQISEDDFTPNVAKGCTGDTYLKRTGTELEKEREVISRRIAQSINSRYIFMGYIQFHRMIDDLLKGIPKGLDEEVMVRQRDRILRREFSGRLVIIDEAHNLRDNPAESADDDTDNPGGDTELTESQAGKRLTPTLIKVLNAAEGMKLLLMSGTPMYNSYKEIIFLLNLLLMNDKKVTLSERDIFDPVKGAFTKKGEELLGAAANAYVSFMRGENPLSFPVRLSPQGTPPVAWPENAPDGKPVAAEKRDRMTRLPFVPVQFEGASMDAYLNISQEAIEAGGLGVGSIDEMVQSGNWLFPTEDAVQIRDAGFDGCFEDVGGGGLSQFRSRRGAPKWLLRDSLGTASPKAKLTLERAQTAKGIVFIYSRFIKSGALPLALALEANGYSPWGDRKSLLIDGIQDELGRQCALCPKREKAHGGAGHKFVPAKYVIITGRANVSPNNARVIQAARAKTNMDGREVKIIIGSQVASEGIDFRFVREIYVFDSWFHLNKMEQVLGRGIRTCSHSIMKEEERNCTIHLLVNTFGEKEDTETADLYMYRNAMSKAVQMGRVTRVLKRYALDCNLNHDAIVVTGLASQRHVDSQGNVREEVDINDTPFTNVCDWIETCDYTCAKKEIIDPEHYDMSTYDDYAVRWRESELKSAIRSLFKERKQPFFQVEDIREMLSAIPPKAVSGLLSDIINNKSFRIQMPVEKTGRMIDGYIVYRNGYYMFQPDYLSDIRIPLALRVADVPVKRDSYEPTTIKVAAAAEKAEAAVAPVGPDTESVEGTLNTFWKAIKDWVLSISKGEAPLDDIPESVQKAISERYVGDAELRENDQLIMVNWLYEHIQKTDYGEKKRAYLVALAEALLGMVWDESLKPNEQLELLTKESDPLASVMGEAAGQIIVYGGTKAVRIIDILSGSVKYFCGSVPCSEAVARVFDTHDPLQGIEANNTNTGKIYGFVVPKGKEGRLVFKTNDRPVAQGVKPEKGGECSIVSSISYHIHMLKDIAELLAVEGYPKFILVEEYLDEKVLRRKQEEEAKAEAKLSGTKYEKAAVELLARKTEYAKKGKHPFKTRTFENAVRACALKDIVLRWMDIMQKQKSGRRYFYRPIAALKSGHKGSK